jgi:prepilin signal peptidase PulO-like enzyme (type II secretory pathway)
MAWLLIITGIIIGALVNLLADSLPVVRRLQWPVCAHCGARRSPLAWSGLVAFVAQKRRCQQCHNPLSMRHLFVEVATPAVFVFAWTRTGTSIITLFNILHSAILILIFVTDLEHRLILHVVSLPAIALGIVGAFANPIFDRSARSLLGGALGLLAALTLYAAGMLFGWLIGRARGSPLAGPAFGFGDVTLTTYLGLMLGAPEIIFAILLAILLGFAFATLYLVVRGVIRREHEMFTAFVPYGPFLIAGGIYMLYFGTQFMAWYLDL